MTDENRAPRIIIVGGGVSGLSTGVCLQRTIPGVEITIVADAFYENITSYGAAGMIRCSTFKFGLGPTEEISKKWFGDTYKFMADLALSKDSGKAGITKVSGYFVGSNEEELVSLETLEPFTNEIVDLKDKDLAAISTVPDLRHAKLVTTYVADSAYYLLYLESLYKKNGGKFEVRTVKTLAEFVGQCDVVVNCSGLRAKDLVNDLSIFSVRGQVLKLKAPWIKHFYYHGLNTYIIPGIDYITVGGTRQLSNPSLEIDAMDSYQIMERVTKLVPSLKNAKIEREWVGLRPQRNPIRVEKEILKFGPDQIKVVHNYGHGGYGVTLSWGTARHATELILEHLHGTGLASNIKVMNIPSKL